jgi:DNA-binding NtrC family response regulator
LVMEDGGDVFNATAAMLERLGCSVKGETQSLETLRAFSEAPDRFDLAILDNVMDGVTGLDLAKRFKHIRSGVPVMPYTGNGDKPTPEEIEAAGLGWVIFKPLTSGELEGLLMDALILKEMTAVEGPVSLEPGPVCH